jgi:hypothetical protein
MQEGCDASLRIAEPPGDQQDTEWTTFWANHKGARSAFT